MQNLLIKTLDTLCRSCRGIGDLQLRCWSLGPLVFRNFEKSAVQQGHLNLNRASRSHARDAGVTHRPAPRSAGSARRGQPLVRRSMRCSQNCYATTRLAQSARAARPRHAAQPVAATPYLAGAHARRCRPTAHAAPCTASSRLGVQATSPTDSKIGYKSSSPSFARGNATPPSRPCRPLGAHGELHPPAACNANTCHSRLPLAPTKLPRPLVGHAEPPARRSRAPSGGRRRSPLRRE
jgi:hypothetical protein